MSNAGPTAKKYTDGQMLFREGDHSTSLFLIRKGTVSIRKAKGKGFIEIARIYSGEVIGELSFFDRLPRSATAVATAEVEALEIPFDSLDKMYALIPDYLKRIINSVAERLRKANEMIRRLKQEAGDILPDEEPAEKGVLDSVASAEDFASFLDGEKKEDSGGGTGA